MFLSCTHYGQRLYVMAPKSSARFSLPLCEVVNSVRRYLAAPPQEAKFTVHKEKACPFRLMLVRARGSEEKDKDAKEKDKETSEGRFSYI